MRTISARFPGSKTIQMLAISCLVLSLAACKSNGTVQTSMGGTVTTNPVSLPPEISPPDDNPPVVTPPTVQTTPFTPLQNAVGEASEGLRAVPMLLNDLGGLTDGLLGEVVQNGDGAGASPMLMRSARSSTALSPVLSELGLGLDSLLLSTENGVGQLGNSSDPIGTTLAGAEGLALHTGAALNNAGETVKALGARLGPASAVTDVVGNAVGGVSQLVTQVGGTAGSLITSAPITGLTSTVNGVATPIVGTVLGSVQNVGVATGLAEPIDNLLSSVGGLVSSVGTQAQSSGMPVITPVGMLLDQVGLTVTALGGIGGADAASSGGLLNGGLLGGGLLNGGLLGGGLLGGDGAANPVTGLLGGLLGSNNGGLLSGGAANPVTGLVGGLLGPNNGGLLSGGAANPVTGLVGGLLGANGSSNSPLAPLGNILTGVTGGVSTMAQTPLSSAPSTTPSPLANLLAPLTSLLQPPKK